MRARVHTSTHTYTQNHADMPTLGFSITFRACTKLAQIKLEVTQGFLILPWHYYSYTTTSQQYFDSSCCHSLRKIHLFHARLSTGILCKLTNVIVEITKYKCM